MDEELTADLPLWKDEDAFKLLQNLCEKHGISPDIFRKLVAIERRHQHRGRARGIYEEFDATFEEVN